MSPSLLSSATLPLLSGLDPLGLGQGAPQVPSNPLAACSATLPLQASDLVALMSDDGRYMQQLQSRLGVAITLLPSPQQGGLGHGGALLPRSLHIVGPPAQVWTAQRLIVQHVHDVVRITQAGCPDAFPAGPLQTRPRDWHSLQQQPQQQVLSGQLL